jgi:hypothetical protein
MAQAFRYDYFSEKKRENENKLRDVYNYINDHKTCSQSVSFLEKDKKRLQAQQLAQQQKNFDIQQENFLNLRRKKLSNLLGSEEYNYHMEIINGQETSMDVKRRMEKELMELRRQRLSEKDNDIQKLNQRRFFESADELRKNDSQAFAVECYLEQENQMLDKMRRREKEKQEEMFYVKLNELDNMKKVENEKKDEEKHKNNLQNIYDYQQWQRDQKNKEMQHNNEISELENARLKEQWRRDKEAEEQNEKNRKAMNAQVYKDIEEFNRKEEEERKKKLEFEKMKDKELVDSIVAKEKALDLIDKQEKERKIKEFAENKKYLEYVMNQKKEAEAWMDKLAQDEADRAYKKEMDEWKKEEDKRIQLLKDVYKGREDALRYKKQQLENEKNLMKQEREELDQKINNYYDYLEQVNKNEFEKRKNHQNQLRYQIQMKDQLRKREMQDVLYEERAAQLWEQDYQNKINEQRALHLQRLKEIRERNAYTDENN